jgi:hypothetical protein
MTTGKRLTEFGKRGPTPLPPAPGPKRSSHVALLVMGTLAVGGGAYTLMPRESCGPAPPPTAGMAAPATPASTACTTRASSGSSGGYSRSSRLSFFGGDSAGASSSTSVPSSSGISRGGFGSFAHAFGFGGG